MGHHMSESDNIVLIAYLRLRLVTQAEAPWEEPYSKVPLVYVHVIQAYTIQYSGTSKVVSTELFTCLCVVLHVKCAVATFNRSTHS